MYHALPTCQLVSFVPRTTYMSIEPNIWALRCALPTRQCTCGARDTRRDFGWKPHCVLIHAFWKPHVTRKFRRRLQHAVHGTPTTDGLPGCRTGRRLPASRQTTMDPHNAPQTLRMGPAGDTVSARAGRARCGTATCFTTNHNGPPQCTDDVHHEAITKHTSFDPDRVRF